MEALISVIIPIYNMEAYLARCLDSVLNNTYRNLEVLCVDDGSTDGSAQILRAYAEKDSRIVPIFKENGGVSSARNAGLDRVTGEYVTFVDPDDYVHPQYVELLYRALRESGTSISICGFQTVEEKETQAQPEQISFDCQTLRMCSFSEIFKSHNLRSYCWGKLLRRTLVGNIRFLESLRLAEDTLFFAEVCENEATDCAVTMPYPLYYYFQREGSAVRLAGPQQFIQFGNAWIQKLLLSGRDDIYLDKAVKWCLSTRYQSVHMFFEREIARECTKLLKEIKGKLWTSNQFGTMEKAVFFAFIHFPWLYWLYRSFKDPSMLAWEKVERKKRREAQKNEGT